METVQSAQGSRKAASQSTKLPLSPPPVLTPPSSPSALQPNQSIRFQSVELPLSGEPPPMHSFKLPSSLPLVPSFCFKAESSSQRKPLLDIEDVRAFIRSKRGPPKEGKSHSAGNKVSYGVFGIGTMGSSGSDGGYVPLSSSQANEHRGEISSHPSAYTQTLSDHPDRAQYGNIQPYPENIYGESTQDNQMSEQNGRAADDHGLQYNDQGFQYHNGQAPSGNEGPYPLLDINDVRDAVDSFLHHTGFRRYPTTSWMNKMPWHVPRAHRLAKGLEWPPESFPSEEVRQSYYRKARKRKRFLLGSLPLWTVPALNLAFIQLLMYNPLQKFFDYLRTLP